MVLKEEDDDDKKKESHIYGCWRHWYIHTLCMYGNCGAYIPNNYNTVFFVYIFIFFIEEHIRLVITTH